MFIDSYSRACRILRFVKKLEFPFMSLGGPRHGARVWCLGQLPKHRNQWQELEGLLFSPQEVEGLLFSPKNSQLVHILSYHSQGVVSLFIFPTGTIALDFEPRGRRYVKNMIYNRNRLYSKAIHCLASMEMHYVQWFLLKSVYEITDCEKIRFCLLESGRTKPWCPGLVSRPSAKAQEPLARSRGQWQEVGGSGKKQRACYLAPKTLS